MNGLYTWLTIGLLMIISEFFIPGFVIFFFGVAAILVGVLQLFIPMSFPVCLLSVCVLGTVLLFLLRRYVPGVLKGTVLTDKCEQDIDNDGVIGKRVRVIEKIGPELPGKVELNGVLWNATADCLIEAGQTVEITGKKNLTVTVRTIQ